MIKNSLKFTFGNKHSDELELGLINVSLSRGLYKEALNGNRKIKEVKIPGRKYPYLYGIEEAPMKFKMIIAFENPVTIKKIREVASWLLAPKTYTDLVFDEQPFKVYKAIFVGQPILNYTSEKEDGTGNILSVGYITLDVRLDGPGPVMKSEISNFVGPGILQFDNVGDTDAEVNLAINITGAAVTEVELINNTNSSGILFGETVQNEIITVDGKTKIITSTNQSNKPIYPRWNRKYLVVSPGINNINVPSGVTIDMNCFSRAYL